ncbi:6005_t:CDS:2, partial [Scutellospora calospora]
KENTSQRISTIFSPQNFESVDLLQQRSPTNIMVMDSIVDPTCDQKHMLLYNVQQPFEVLMTEFDDEYHKTLVNRNSWKTFVCHFAKHFELSTRKEGIPSSSDYTYNLNENDKLKYSQAVRVLVEKEAVKNYSIPAIVNAVKEYASKKLDLSTSVKKLNNKNSINVAAAIVIVRRFCSTWKPRYFLADQSSIEAKSIMTVFLGLSK